MAKFKIYFNGYAVIEAEDKYGAVEKFVCNDYTVSEAEIDDIEIEEE